MNNPIIKRAHDIVLDDNFRKIAYKEILASGCISEDELNQVKIPVLFRFALEMAIKESKN